MDADRENPWARRFAGESATSSRDFERATVRGTARHLALSLLGRLDRLAGQREALARPRTQVVLMHHLFEDEVQPFDRLLGDLARDHELVGYDEAVRRVASGSHPRPAIAFSFDDGRASCARAAEILEAHGCTGAFFVCPAIVGARDRATIRAFCLDRLHYPPTDFLDWDDLARLRQRGHAVGNHTLGHRNLARCDPAMLTDEIDSARSRIVERLGGCDHFAWPYGGIANATAEAIGRVFAGGHRSCASALRGAHAGPAAALGCIRRDHLLPRWPLGHVRWFLARNARRCGGADDAAWPPGWGETVAREGPG